VGLSTREGRIRRRRRQLERLQRQTGIEVAREGRIADICFQQSLTRASEFDVIATMNLNGDYLLGRARGLRSGPSESPGSEHQLRDSGHGIFEATHGTAPKYAGMDKVNPGSVLLSGVLMFEHLGWTTPPTTSFERWRRRSRQDRHV